MLRVSPILVALVLAISGCREDPEQAFFRMIDEEPSATYHGHGLIGYSGPKAVEYVDYCHEHGLRVSALFKKSENSSHRRFTLLHMALYELPAELSVIQKVGDLTVDEKAVIKRWMADRSAASGPEILPGVQIKKIPRARDQP